MLRIEATVPSFSTSPSISVPPQPQSHPLLSPYQRFRVRVCVGSLATIAVSEPTAAPSSPAALLRACSTSAIVAFPPSPSSVRGLPATAVVDCHHRQPRRRHRALPRENPAPDGDTITTCSTPALPPVSQRPTPPADTTAAHAESITEKEEADTVGVCRHARHSVNILPDRPQSPQRRDAASALSPPTGVRSRIVQLPPMGSNATAEATLAVPRQLDSKRRDGTGGARTNASLSMTFGKGGQNPANYSLSAMRAMRIMVSAHMLEKKCISFSHITPIQLVFSV